MAPALAKFQGNRRHLARAGDCRPHRRGRLLDGVVLFQSTLHCGGGEAGLCNPGVLASYITLPALTSCLGIGAGFATLTGGYNIVMLNKERQRADDAEERAIKAQERADQAVEEYRELYRKMIEEHLAERREERRRAEEAHQALLANLEEQRQQTQEERLRAQEERRQSAETHQAMMSAIAQLVQRGNGSHSSDHDRTNDPVN